MPKIEKQPESRKPTNPREAGAHLIDLFINQAKQFIKDQSEALANLPATIDTRLAELEKEKENLIKDKTVKPEVFKAAIATNQLNLKALEEIKAKMKF